MWVTRQTTPNRQIIWPGFGLIMGTGLGAAASFLIGTDQAVTAAMGAGIGLVVGAFVDLMMSKRRSENAE